MTTAPGRVEKHHFSCFTDYDPWGLPSMALFCGLQESISFFFKSFFWELGSFFCTMWTNNQHWKYMVLHCIYWCWRSHEHVTLQDIIIRSEIIILQNHKLFTTNELHNYMRVHFTNGLRLSWNFGLSWSAADVLRDWFLHRLTFQEEVQVRNLNFHIVLAGPHSQNSYCSDWVLDTAHRNMEPFSRASSRERAQRD